MSGHTPGPWRVGTLEWDVYAGGEESLRKVADCHPYPQIIEEELANARLIAAAPELLGAAKWVLHEVFMNSGAPDIEARTTEALGRLAEAAAKAEGRQ